MIPSTDTTPMQSFISHQTIEPVNDIPNKSYNEADIQENDEIYEINETEEIKAVLPSAPMQESIPPMIEMSSSGSGSGSGFGRDHPDIKTENQYVGLEQQYGESSFGAENNEILSNGNAALGINLGDGNSQRNLGYPVQPVNVENPYIDDHFGNKIDKNQSVQNIESSQLTRKSRLSSTKGRLPSLIELFFE